MYKLKMSPNEIRNQIQIKPKEWHHLATTNCYAYALGLDIRESEICKHAYNPGTISKIFNLVVYFDYFLYSTLVKNLEKDLKKLKISYRQIEPNDIIKEDEWKIALFVNKSSKVFNDDLLLTNFHFLRANSTGNWTYKPGCYGSPREIDDKNQIIINPKECYFDYYEYRKCNVLKINER